MSEETAAGQLVINGTVNRKVYYSLKPYIMAPMFKIGQLILTAGYDLWLVYQAFAGQNWANLIIAALFTAAMILFYRRNQNMLVRKAISSQPEIRDGDGLLITLSFGRQQIRMENHALKRERNLPYKDFVSMVETDAVIALFVRGGNYLMIPKDMMDDAKHEKVMAIIHEKCPNLRKRI